MPDERLEPSHQPMLEQMFVQALEIADPAERRAFLDRACAGNGALRSEVESLLAAHAEAGTFIDKPVSGQETVQLSTRDILPRSEQSGDRIGRYKLLQQIGEGGCGVVWMAEQEEPVRRRVALKVIKLGMDTKSVIARFEAERQALALMDHPNIAKVFDAGATDTGRPYFVMELVRGVRITDYCDQHKLSMRERLDLFIKVCQAVQHAHQKGIIHRDIKPSNILVTLHDGVAVPKVIDFGIAKATTGQRLTDRTVFTEFQQFIGTPAYMSPEQAEMSGLDIDTRSDIYSLGVLLYELLTSKTPFEAEQLLRAGLDEMRRLIREDQPVRPSTRLSTLSIPDTVELAKHRNEKIPALINLIRGDLDWIVMKCLEKDRTRRYETANGLARDVQRHLDHDPVVARPPSAGYRFQKLVRRNRLAFVAGGVVLLTLVLGVVVSTWQALRANRNAQKVQKASAELELNLYAADIYLAQNAIKEGNYGLAKKALQAHVPHKGTPDVRGFEWCYFWKLCQGDKLASWHAHSNVVNSLAVSPDGKLIASASPDHEAKLWDAASHRLLATFPESDTVAFSPDGHLLFIANHGGRVEIRKVGNWERTAEFSTGDKPGETPIAQIAVSPTDPIVAVCTDGDFFGGRGSLRLFNYRTLKEIDRLVDSGDRMAFSSDGKTLVTGSAQGEIKVWDVATKTKPKSLGPIGGLCSLALSPDGRVLATTEFWDFDVRLWDLAEGRELTRLDGHDAMVWSVAFSPDGRILASSSSDQTIRLWDVETQKQAAVFIGHESEIWTLAFSPTGESLFSGSKDETLAIWPSRPRQEHTAIPSVLRRSHPPIFASDGRTVVAPGAQGGLVIGDIPTAQVKTVLRAEKIGLWLSPDSKTLLAVATNDAIHFWDLPSHSLRQSIEPTPRVPPISRAVASRDGKHIATVSAPDGSVRVWETGSGFLKATLKGEIQAIVGMDFSPNNRLIATGGDSFVEVWDLETQNPFVTFQGHKYGVSSVAFSPDGDTLASSSTDNTVKLWTVSGRRELATLRGHKEGVLYVAFAPDGRTLATASGDRTFKLWNVPTRREVAWFQHSIPIVYVGFSPDSSCFAYVCDHGQLIFLRCPSLAEIDASLTREGAGKIGQTLDVPLLPPERDASLRNRSHLVRPTVL